MCLKFVVLSRAAGASSAWFVVLSVWPLLRDCWVCTPLTPPGQDYSQCTCLPYLEHNWYGLSSSTSAHQSQPGAWLVQQPAHLLIVLKQETTKDRHQTAKVHLWRCAKEQSVLYFFVQLFSAYLFINVIVRNSVWGFIFLILVFRRAVSVCVQEFLMIWPVSPIDLFVFVVTYLKHTWKLFRCY